MVFDKRFELTENERDRLAITTLFDINSYLSHLCKNTDRAVDIIIYLAKK